MTDGKADSPWSSFHTSVALSARGPGSPQRPRTPQAPGEAAESAVAAASVVGELGTHLAGLDLLVEYKLLCLNCPSGVYVIPSAKSLHEWHGVVFVHSGPYRDAVFRFTVFIPDEFPKAKPILRFSTRIYHPYIHTHNGILNASRVFPHWDPSKHHIWHFLVYTKACFYDAATWQGVAEDSFLAQARICAQESHETAHSPDDTESGSVIQFTELSDELYKQAKDTLFQGVLPSAPLTSSSQGMLSSVTEQFKHIWEKITSH